jgi:hypothetical protein
MKRHVFGNFKDIWQQWVRYEIKYSKTCLKRNLKVQNIFLLKPLTEMSTRNLREGKGRPASKAENLTAMYELIV